MPQKTQVPAYRPAMAVRSTIRRSKTAILRNAGPGQQDVFFDNEECPVVPLGTVKELVKKIKPVMRYDREGNLYVAELSMTSFHRPSPGA